MHDFRLYQDSKITPRPKIIIQVDSGYEGIQQYHANSKLPKKKSKLRALTKADKRANQKLAAERILNEHVIGKIKRFRILACRYRNRRKRFGLRVTLISAIYNFELA